MRPPNLFSLAMPAILAVTSLFSSCKTVQPIKKTDPDTPMLEQQPALNTSRHGLEVLRWTTSTDSGEDPLLQIGEEPLLKPSVTSRLQQDGFVVRMLDIQEMADLIVAIGGTTTDMSIWHGQVFDWRLLHEASTPPGGAVLIDGRAVMLDSGNPAIEIRSWTVPTEDGAVMQVELLPTWIDDQPIGLDKVLSPRRELSGTAIPLSGFETDIARDMALLVTCSPLSVSIGSTDDPADSQQAEQDDEPSAEEESDPGQGPVAMMPPTLAQALFGFDRPVPGRTILVLIPHLPSILFPASTPSPEQTTQDTELEQ